MPTRSQDEDLEHVWADLRRHGLRRTGPRVSVLRVLTEDGGHLTAPEIHERLRATGEATDLATVYRSVTTLAELGVLHATARADHPTSFGLATRGHHHVLCTGCGAVREISAEALAKALPAVRAETGFHLDHANVVVQGRCPACAATG